MNENQLFSLVGDDDSGPEDVEDDLDLECETVKTITLKFFFTLQEPATIRCWRSF
jgi:hypothetical protein